MLEMPLVAVHKELVQSSDYATTLKNIEGGYKESADFHLAK